MDETIASLTDWETFRRRCLKPDPNRLGSWTARRLGRPAALHITSIVAPWGMSANQATAGAMLVASAAIVAFGFGTAWGWLIGALLLPLWYLLDHVDGQLARWHRTASLDGTMIDYLMHHSVNMLLPIGLGFGLMRETGFSIWCVAGILWGWSALILGLRHDARYKAFVQRLKLLHGELRIVGGGGGRPEAATMPRRSPIGWIKWLVLKAYETHIVMFALAIVGIFRIFFLESGPFLAGIYVGTMALPAPVLALVLVVRGLKNDEAEREFAAWYRVRETDTLEFRDGWWFAEPVPADPLSVTATVTYAETPQFVGADAGVSS
ncbi:MAG: CDP-alcohol phosphatidyltransferase family protein [Planctomycetia bacterium]|nr:CDP-alcohol phosphatidyltransferase family protein [Planctomycetia bacterium]